MLFTTSPDKEADAKRLGADEVVISTDAEQMAAHAGSFDFIIDTVSAPHDLDAYLEPAQARRRARPGRRARAAAPGRRLHPDRSSAAALAGSAIGGIAETQEMLDFCAEHGIVSDIEMIPIQQINEAYERMLKSDVKYRFVIDMASLAEVRPLAGLIGADVTE